MKNINKINKDILPYINDMNPLLCRNYDLDWAEEISKPNAIMFASGYISNLFGKDPDFEWNRYLHTCPSFDDMNFRYKNNIFSVLVEIHYNGIKLPIDPEYKETMLKITKENNLIPCIFPIEITDDFKEYNIRPITDGFNLFNLETRELIDPIKMASNKQVQCSKYELKNKAIRLISDLLEDNGFTFSRYFDDPYFPSNYPNLWFLDENDMPCWVLVQVVKNKKLKKLDVDKILKFDPLLKKARGYYAPVIFGTKGETIYRDSHPNITTLKNVILKIYDPE